MAAGSGPQHPGVLARARLVLLVTAGVLYNAWLVGLVTEPGVLTGNYVSVLEAPGHRHADLFVACDVVTGACAIAAGVLLVGRRRLPGAALVAFGVGNILEATIPITSACTTSIRACGIAPSVVFTSHDVVSLVSMAGLALTLWGERGARGWRPVAWAWGLGFVAQAVAVVTTQWTTFGQAAFLLASGVTLAAVGWWEGVP